MRRTSTGNPRIDEILHGGLLRHSINIVMGLPGTGKTLFAQQLAFASGTADRPALYLSTLSEPLEKLVTYLQELSFSDVDRIGSEVLYDSLAGVLAEDPAKVEDECMRLLREHRPGVLVIDSFKAIAELVPNTIEWRKLLYDLASLLSAYDLTTLWVGEYEAGAVVDRPEFAVADGIVELERRQAGSRDDRFLRVVKLRGSGFRDGRHAFEITGEGLQVFPRLIGPDRYDYRAVPERLQTGIGGLDPMIESGWLRGTSTLVEGPSGAGKTMLGLHFLRHGVEAGEPGLLVSFQESPVQTHREMRSLGWEPDDLLGPKRLDLFHASPVELQIDTIVRELLDRIETNGVRRVVIDALGDLRVAARDDTRFSDYVYALTQEFAVRGVTAMLPFEAMPGSREGVVSTSAEISYMSDNIVLLSMDLKSELTRTIRIAKTRASAHDGSLHVLRIGPGGLRVE